MNMRLHEITNVPDITVAPELDISAPAHSVRRFLTGQCFAFAIAAQTYAKNAYGVKLNLMGLFNEKGEPEHAFLVDPRTNFAYDARGKMPLDANVLGQGSAEEGKLTIGPLTKKQINQYVTVDLTNIKKVIASYVRPVR